MFSEFREDLVDAFGDADASLDRRGTSTHRAKLAAKRLGFVMTVVVIDRHVRAAGCELARDGPADAAGSARDERNLTGERACHRLEIRRSGKPLF